MADLKTLEKVVDFLITENFDEFYDAINLIKDPLDSVGGALLYLDRVLRNGHNEANLRKEFDDITVKQLEAWKNGRH